QNLSLNPTKLSGQCGRLKCCLNYELETYLAELKDIPKVDRDLQTEKGYARLQKTDIFRKIMWFSYSGDETNWMSIPVDRVNYILEQNKKGIKPLAISAEEEEFQIEHQNDVKNEDLIALDKKYKGSSNKKKKKKKPTGGPPIAAQPGNLQANPRPNPQGNPRPNPAPKPKPDQQSGSPTSSGPKPENRNAGNQNSDNKNRNRNRNQGRGPKPNRPNPPQTGGTE
ncbi:MAG TPA: Signal peptidase-like protein, partial [Catalimonadaceae bacterium]|nr:Signal peptidase-like protein [Catalimonadaceae bacterium]